MRHPAALTVILLTVCLAQQASADTGTPAAQEPRKDAPPPVAADQTTPRGTLKVFALAVQAAEGDKVRQCLHTAGDIEEKYAQGYADVSVALGRFRTAMIKRFGDKAAPTLRVLAPIREGHHIDAASETIDGGTASVEIKGDQPETIALVKVDGKWKIAVSAMVAKRSAADSKADMAAMKVMTDAYGETGKEVADGKHKSPPAAVSALRRKIAARLPKKVASVPTTTRPD